MSYIENKINILLKDEIEFEKYINRIENENIKVPDGINEKILNKINILEKENEVKNQKSKHKYKFIDLLKVSCFTALTLITWEVGIANIKNIDNINIGSNIRSFSLSEQQRYMSEKIGDFFMNPINKGGEK